LRAGSVRANAVTREDLKAARGSALRRLGRATLRQPLGDLANVVETPAFLRPQRDVPLLTRHEQLGTVPDKNLYKNL
jgi:hypothetical protein